MHAVETRCLTKVFHAKNPFSFVRSGTNSVIAIENVSFTADAGQSVAITGENGSGKTTLLKMLAGLVLPTSGSALVCGYDSVTGGKQARKRVGYAPAEERSLYWKLTARANLEFHAALHGLPSDISLERINRFIDALDLSAHAETRVEEYSSGMRQRLSVARCLLHDPEVLLLDEPTKCLDDRHSAVVRSLIKSLAKDKGKTIIFATHVRAEAEETADTVVNLGVGKTA